MENVICGIYLEGITLSTQRNQFTSFASMPIETLQGAGEKTVKQLAKMGVETILDLILHFPFRYEDRSKVVRVIDATPNMQVGIVGKVTSNRVRNGRRPMLTIMVSDGTAEIACTFFNYTRYHLNQFRTGQPVWLYGTVKYDKYVGLQIMHPQIKALEKQQAPTDLVAYYIPIYPLSGSLTQEVVQDLTKKAFETLKGTPPQALGYSITGMPKMDFVSALKYLHNPPINESFDDLNNRATPVHIALIKDELLAHCASLLCVREESDRNQGIEIVSDNKLRMKLLASLHFHPTGAQRKVVGEIDADLSRSRPMMRLVQGDVGSGKTLVAALAALRVIAFGAQAVLMVPTELLAEQHLANMKRWLEPLGVKVDWLTGKAKGKARAATLAALASGDTQLLIGTHALFQADVVFHRLGLMIVDEQHRFGVHQRLALRDKGTNGTVPHQLVMTATPIPRTLAMVAYADLDTSIIDELPPGRRPIRTVALPDSRRNEVISRIRATCEKEMRQVYWVCTLIEESATLESQTAEETYQLLKAQMPELRVGMVHGRMKPAEKHQVMKSFAAHELDVLVATTVIEVGVDVPNASLMVIENPERLGLAQLHQLRGRVGRGDVDSSCVLLYKPPLSQFSSQRLSVLRDTNDGFIVAQRDLEIRGPGDMLGVKQTGVADMRLADLVRDEALLVAANRLALIMVQKKSPVIQALRFRWCVASPLYANT